MTWHDVTVGQLQALSRYELKSDTVDIDEMGKLVSAMYSLTPKDIEEIDSREFIKLYWDAVHVMNSEIPEAKPVKVIKANGRRYKVIYNLRQQTVKQQTVYSALASRHLENMARSFACLVVPVNRWGKRVERNFDDIIRDMQAAPVVQVRASLLYFNQVYQEQLRVATPALVLEMMSEGMSEEKAREIMEATREAYKIMSN